MELLKITVSLLGQLNYVAVLVAALVMFVVGFVWYGPLFGKRWMKYMAISHDDMKKKTQKDMIPAYALTFVGGFVEAMFLLFFTLLLQTQFWHAALMIWIGFIVFNSMSPVLWAGKKWGFFVLDAGHRLVNLLVAGIVFSFFF